MTLRVGRKALLISQLYFLLRTGRAKKKKKRAAFSINWARSSSFPEALFACEKGSHSCRYTSEECCDVICWTRRTPKLLFCRQDEGCVNLRELLRPAFQKTHAFAWTTRKMHLNAPGRHSRWCKTDHVTSSLKAETDAWNVLNMQAHGNKHHYLYSQCVISRLPRIGIHPLWCTIVVKYLMTPPVSSRSTCPVVLLVWLECERPGGNKKRINRELHVKSTLCERTLSVPHLLLPLPWLLLVHFFIRCWRNCWQMWPAVWLQLKKNTSIGAIT